MKTTRSTWFVWFLGSLLWSPQLHAAPSSRKHDGWQQKVKLHQLKRPLPRRAPATKKPKRKALSIRAWGRFARIKAAQKLRQKIRDLKQIIRYAKRGARADLRFRLGEHYWELGRYYEFQGHKYDAYRSKPDWPEKQRLQAQAWRRAKQHRRMAAQSYFRIIKQHPGYRRLCETYYFLGKNLRAMGKPKRALGVYRAMLKRFAGQGATCPFVPNAYLAFGEYYFLQGHVRTALKSYQQVLHFRGSSIYGFALYKIAWCHYNLAQYQASLRTFVQVVRYAKKPDQTSQQRRRVQLLRESLRDLVLAYSRAGQARSAPSQFLQWGGQRHQRKMLIGLGQLYQEQGQNPQVIIVYRALLRLDQRPIQRLRYRLLIAQAIDRSQSKGSTIVAARRLQQAVLATRKSVRGRSSKYALQAVEKDIEQQLAEWATYLHYESQKTRRTVYYRQAAAFYAIYLALYPTSKRAHKMGFFYAEILFFLKEYEQAAQAYVANQARCRHAPNRSCGKFARDMAYNPILAYDALLKRQSAAKAQRQRWRSRMIQIATGYLKQHSKGTRAIDVAYRLGRMHYSQKQYAQAARLFQWIYNRQPGHKYALYGAHSLLDIYQIQQRWKQLRDAANGFSRQQAFSSAARREFQALAGQAALKHCESLQKRQKHLAAGRCYKQIIATNPKAAGVVALFNGAMAFYRGHDIDEAIAMSRRLLQAHPSSQYAQRTRLSLANIFASRAQFQAAADRFETYLTHHKGTRAAARAKAATSGLSVIFDARLRAGQFREMTGKSSRAIGHYRWLLSQPRFCRKHHKVAIGLYFKVAKLMKKNGSLSRYHRHLRMAFKGRSKRAQVTRRLLPPALQLVARMHYARSLRQRGDLRRAQQAERVVVKAFARLPKHSTESYAKAKAAAAEAAFGLARRESQTYQSIRWTQGLRQKQRERRLAQKRSALQAALKGYRKVIAYKQGKWGVAALFQAGEMTFAFARFLRAAPAPHQRELRKNASKLLRKVLTEKGIPRRLHRQLLRQPRFQQLLQRLMLRAQRQYAAQRERSTRPYEQTAAQFYQRSLKLAHKLHVYHRWTLRAQKRLTQLQPRLHPQRLETLPQISFATTEFAFARGLVAAPARPASHPAKRAPRPDATR